MQIYSCKVRLSGNVNNEVRKPEVSAAEVLVLRQLHGADAVLEVKRVRMEHAPHAKERDRLNRVYGAKIITQLFGAAHNDLPVRVADLDETDGDEAPAPKRPVGRPSRAAAEAESLVG